MSKRKPRSMRNKGKCPHQDIKNCEDCDNSRWMSSSEYFCELKYKKVL